MKSFVIFNVLPAAIMAMAVPDYAYYGASTSGPSTIRVCRKKTSYSAGSTVAPSTTVTTITTTTDGATSTITSTITSSSSDITTTTSSDTTTTTETSTETTTGGGTTTDIVTSTSTTSDLPGTTTTTSDSATSTCPIVFVNPRCARDNCLRAIIACSAKPGPSVGLADCSSYALAAQQTITAGDPVTVTATETTITTIPGPGTATITAAPTDLVCYADNCVRAFLRFESSASEFCATYTQTINTDTAVPSFALNCPTTAPAAALSSGCACLSAITAPTPRIAMAVVENAPVATITSAPSLKRRQALATVPDYASSCSGSARYESACACLGVTAGTLTVPPATITETVTTTLTAAI